MLPKEELWGMDKDGALFIGWSINTAGPFPWDEDGDFFLLVALDPLS